MNNKERITKLKKDLSYFEVMSYIGWTLAMAFGSTLIAIFLEHPELFI